MRRAESGPGRAMLAVDHSTIVRFLDSGHFALETYCDEIAAAIREFLNHSKLS